MGAGILPPFQGGTLFDLSFPARCAGLILFGAFSAEDKLGHYWMTAAIGISLANRLIIGARA
jgi:hypothetical protein